MPFFRRSTEEDCVRLAADLRPEDLAEIEACHGPLDPAIVLKDGLEGECYTSLDEDDNVLFMFGVRKTATGGVIWLLASEKMLDHKRALLRLVKPTLQLLSARYGVLHNVIDARNKVHLRWVKWAGFKFTGRQYVGHDPTVPFLEFLGDFRYVCPSSRTSSRAVGDRKFNGPVCAGPPPSESPECDRHAERSECRRSGSPAE